MNGFVHLKQSLKGVWKKMLSIALALLLFELLFTLLAGSSNIKTEMLNDMTRAPEAARKVLGEGFMEAVVKYGIVAFGFIHPFMFALFIFYILAVFWQVLTSEISSGSIGFTLSRPISRKTVFFNAAVLVYAGLAFLGAVTVLTAAGGILVFMDSNLSVTPFISLGWNLYLLMVFIAGYIALFCSFSDTGKKFFTYSSIFLFLFYIIDLAAKLWKPLEILSPVNPFSYYNPMKLLIGSRIAFSQSLVILAVSGIMFWAAAIIFNRRDLPSG